MGDQQQIKRSTALRKVAVGAAVVAAVWGAAWWGVPLVVKQQLQSQASALLGRAVTVEAVAFSPWSLQLTLQNLKVAAADPTQAPQLEVARVYVDASISSLLRLAPVLDALELDAPVLRLAHTAEGGWDFDDVLAKLAQPEPQSKDDAALPTFALYNIALRDGAVYLHDAQRAAEHRLEALQLQLPFISTIASQREVKVQPLLSMRLNGSEVATQAVSTPFQTGLNTQASLQVKGMDLQPLLPYLPRGLPAQLQAATLDTQLQLRFEQQADQPVLQISGDVALRDVQVVDALQRPLLSFDALEVGLADVRPLQQQVALSSVRWLAPQGDVWRSKDGQWLVAAPAASAGPAAPKAVEAHQGAEKEAPSPSWTLTLGHLAVERGAVRVHDASVPGTAPALQLASLGVQAHDVGWPLQPQARWELAAQVPASVQGAGDVAEGASKAGQLLLRGHGTHEVGQAALAVQGVQAQAFAPYVAQWLKVPVAAQLGLSAGVAWHAGQVHARVPVLSVQDLAVGQSGKGAQAGWGGLHITQVQADVGQRQVQVGRVALEAPQVHLQRDAQGRWMFERWLPPGGSTTAHRTGHKAAPAEASPWVGQVDEAHLQAGTVVLEDASLQPLPLALRVSGVDVQLQNWHSQRNTVQVALSAQLAERTRRGTWARPGQLAYNGQVRLDPLQAQGRVQLKAVPLQAFEPYVAPYLNVRLVKALAHWDGSVRYAQRPAGASLRLQGQGQLRDVHVQTLVGDAGAADAVQGPQRSTLLGEREDLLRWKALQLQGVKLALEPQAPLAVSVAQTHLRDFYARVVVLPQGRLNLQNLVRGSEASAVQDGTLDDAVAVPVVAGETAAAQAAAAMAPRIEMGPVTLSGGVVKFSDYFIQPNYSADLTEIGGSLAAFSSLPPAPGEAVALADLSLHGVAQGTAQLAIAGKVNPLAQPLALDVQAKVTGLDLSPLTPYAIKYVGHGIAQGKLSMDVRYEVQPDGQLTARNQLVLNQLNFTEPVPDAPTSLPVRLAVALLADSQGNIDLDLPISGSLNDPQFRVAPVVFKILGNIIRKAVTAPFSLLTGAFAASDADSSDITFEPGQAVWTADAQARLDQLAQVLKDKPQLQVVLQGQADAQIEAEGWKAARIAQWERGGADEDAEENPASEGESARTPAQRLSALKTLYKDTVKERPRNMLGLPKDLPAEDMRALIMQDMAIPEGAWAALGAARAEKVQAYLLSQGVDAQRVFMGQAAAQGSQEAGARVLLNISVQ